MVNVCCHWYYKLICLFTWPNLVGSTDEFVFLLKHTTPSCHYSLLVFIMHRALDVIYVILSFNNYYLAWAIVMLPVTVSSVICCWFVTLQMLKLQVWVSYNFFYDKTVTTMSDKGDDLLHFYMWVRNSLLVSVKNWSLILICKKTILFIFFNTNNFCYISLLSLSKDKSR